MARDGYSKFLWTLVIQAHKNFEQLYHLVEYFRTDCYVFIHIDKKSDFKQEQITQLKKMDQVKGVYEKYSVHWGGFSILESELFLIKEAMKYSEIAYFHLISAQDYPIKPLSFFVSFFSHSDKDYLSFEHVPNQNFDKNTYWRYDYYFPFDYFQRTEKDHKRIDKIIKLQKKIGIRRSVPRHFDHLYGGSAWFSITRNSANVLLDYTLHHPSFYRRLRYTFAPEETYVTTVLANLLPLSQIEKDNKRVILWYNKNGSIPANLGLEHMHIIHESNAFFARKFDYPISKKLIELIDQYLLNESEFKQINSGAWIYNGLQKYKYNPKLIEIIYYCYKASKSKSIIDFGCGAGNYVAALRRLHIPAVGYDANPYTPILSKYIIEGNNKCCEVADLTEDLEFDIPFDMTICFDVLQYIPDTLIDIAINNLCKMTKKLLILKYNKDFHVISDAFRRRGLKINELMTNHVNNQFKDLYIIEAS